VSATGVIEGHEIASTALGGKIEQKLIARQFDLIHHPITAFRGNRPRTFVENQKTFCGILAEPGAFELTARAPRGSWDRIPCRGLLGGT
jgi:hypothetical protein